MTTPVPLLADTPAEENQDVIIAARQLIESAVSGKLVSVVCKHTKTRKEATILCAMEEDEGRGTAQYAPLAMLFTPGNTPWQEYVPPKAGMVHESESS